MINTKKQAVYTAFILIGAALLIYDLAAESDEVYLKIIGLVVLMFGLYSSTRQWASDNDKKNEDDDVLPNEPKIEETENSKEKMSTNDK